MAAITYIGIAVSDSGWNHCSSVWCNSEYDQTSMTTNPEQVSNLFLPDNITGTAVKHLKLFGSL
jgi:hypothetical protein